MKLNEALREELNLITPSEEELRKAGELSSEFISLLKKNGLIAFVGGSFAKGTVVRKKGKQDVDIFVVFDYSEDIFKLEKVLKKIKLPGKLKMIHGSRDYFQIECREIIFEVIPVVRTEDPELAENVTDVSLSHVKYVRGQVKKNPMISGEIRLAKAFCRANRCYGAESYVKGFSGYSLEVLVIYFGSFVKFLKGISRSKGVPHKGAKRVVDPSRVFRNEAEIRRELNASKMQGPIVLIDPTYKYRNVCAGLGEETFEKFWKAAKKFLKKPSLEFFEDRGVDVESLKKLAKQKKAKFVEVDLKTDRQEGDIAGTKMKKFLDFFATELERKQQKVLGKEFDYSGVGKIAKGYLVVKENPMIEVRGPHVDLAEAREKYLKAKGRRAYRRGKYFWTKEKVSIKDVFEKVKKVEEEMGARGNLKFPTNTFPN